MSVIGILSQLRGDSCRKSDLRARSFDVITKHKAMAITLTLVVFGYAGAAISYSYLIGLNIDFPYLCPVCPEIFSLGSPTEKFIGRTIGLGTVNAVVLTAVGWLLIGIVLGLRHIASGRSR